MNQIFFGSVEEYLKTINTEMDIMFFDMDKMLFINKEDALNLRVMNVVVYNDRLHIDVYYDIKYCKEKCEYCGKNISKLIDGEHICDDCYDNSSVCIRCGTRIIGCGEGYCDACKGNMVEKI